MTARAGDGASAPCGETTPRRLGALKVLYQALSLLTAIGGSVVLLGAAFDLGTSTLTILLTFATGYAFFVLGVINVLADARLSTAARILLHTNNVGGTIFAALCATILRLPTGYTVAALAAAMSLVALMSRPVISPGVMSRGA